MSRVTQTDERGQSRTVATDAIAGIVATVETVTMTEIGVMVETTETDGTIGVDTTDRIVETDVIAEMVATIGTATVTDIGVIAETCKTMTIIETEGMIEVDMTGHTMVTDKTAGTDGVKLTVAPDVTVMTVMTRRVTIIAGTDRTDGTDGKMGAEAQLQLPE